ncbi:MAG: conserved repeat domain protein, partial [Variovorax sp.]|nr:conserved repeat domain protein [Variovorax sp.]
MAASPDASAATPPAGLVIRTTATASYLPAGYSQIERTSSNTVTAVIRAVEALTLDGEARVARAPDIDATLNFLLRNTGNVDSSYAFAPINGGSCTGTDTLDLSSLRVVLDANNNGVADAVEPTLTGAAALTLAPGRTASLLVQGHVPNLPTGAACITLEAATQSQHVLARAATLVTIGANPVLAITKTAAFDGPLVPGASKVDFSIDAENIGVRAATPTATAGPAATPIVVNGVATTLVLLRDVLPAGTRYISGTLRSAAWGAVRLFRLPGDAAFSYRTAEDSSAQEVAIGVASLAPNAGLAMRFSAQVLAEAPADVVNQAQLYYSDGTGATAAGSNHVVLGTSAERIGIAKSALPAKQNVDGSGTLDGTATVRFSLLVRNYGGTPLFDVQVLDVLEGSAATAFGVYTVQPVPAAGQYTVVA